MDNVQLMKISHSADNMLEISASLQLFDLGDLDNIVKQFALLDILHYQKQMP